MEANIKISESNSGWSGLAAYDEMQGMGHRTMPSWLADEYDGEWVFSSVCVEKFR